MTLLKQIFFLFHESTHVRAADQREYLVIIKNNSIISG